MKLATAVNRAIRDLDLSDSDKGATELALTYARKIDADGDLLDTLGPKLLFTLESLGMTPRARAAIVKGGGRDSGPSKLDELRERRAARQRDAEDLHAAAAGADA